MDSERFCGSRICAGIVIIPLAFKKNAVLSILQINFDVGTAKEIIQSSQFIDVK